MFRDMNRSLEANRIPAVIDRRFSFDDLGEVKAAYEHLRGATHFGKVVITRG